MKLFEKSSIYLSIIIILLEATIAYTSSSGCSKSLTDNNSTINKENCSKVESGSSSSTCVDTYIHCARRAYMGQCKLYPRRMMHFCCNSCTNINEVTDVFTYNVGCSDTVRDCVKRAIMGQCERYRSSMMYHCCESCTKLKEAEANNAELALLNTQSSECFNFNQRCEVFVSFETCAAAEFRILCCKSCENLKRTTTVTVSLTIPTTNRETESTKGERETSTTLTTTASSDECYDIESSCQEWANNGICEQSPTFMFHFCCKSCKSLGLIAQTTTALPQEPECIDTSDECGNWANGGHCEGTPGMQELCCKSCSLVGMPMNSQF